MLGRCSLTIDGVLVAGVTSGFYRIAAFLIMAGPLRTVPRRTIWTLLWADAEERAAAANLRQTLARIRHLQQEYSFRLIEANVSALYINPHHDIQCDLIASLDQISGRRPGSPVGLAELIGGELLCDLNGSGSEYEEWLTLQRDRLNAELIDGLTAAIEPDSSLSSADREVCARRLLAADPFNEQAYLCLMREAAARRQVARLSKLYTRMRAVLAEELAVEPAPETQETYQRILQSL